MNLDAAHFALLLGGIIVVAFLYSSVGHAGASGYIAVMTLCEVTAAFIRPTALVLNILVACVGAFQFWRAGHFSWRLFWPFALLSVPCAYLGGFLKVPAPLLKPLIGTVLLFSAARLFFRHRDPVETEAPSLPLAVGTGAAIGFLSGVTGTGGGIFLTPLLLFCRWTYTKRAAAISVLFILVNSLAGLAGYVSSGQAVPRFAWLLALAAVVSGAAGSYLGSRRFPVRTISLLLAAVLVIAGFKLVFGG
ncbi:MAG: sulfite exporter TauE/SafE family protein [Chthoniobacterales bacterium]